MFASRGGLDPRSVPWLALCLTVSCCPRCSTAEFVRGSASVAPQGTSFLGKFCFDKTLSLDQSGQPAQAGFLQYTIWMPDHVDARQTHLALFDDQSESYPGNSIAWEHMTCDDRRKRARGLVTVNPGRLMNMTITEHIRERWWFVAIMDCSDSNRLLDITYEVHFINPRQGFQREFSMDHLGILPLSCLLFVLYSSLTLLQLRNNAASRSLWGLGWLCHPLVRMLTASLLSFALAMLLLCAHYAVFALNGRGVLICPFVAKLLQASAKFLLMTILLLLARGRCISSLLTFDDVRWLLKVLLPFLIVCLSLELWGESAESRKYTTGFVYHTDVGWLLVCVDVLLFSAFAASLHATHRVEGDHEKRRFYKALGVSCTMWFLTLPLAAFLALLLAPWVRFKVLFALTNLSHAVACAVIVFILRPDNSTYMDGISSEMATVNAGVTPSLLGNDEGDMKGGWQSKSFKLVLSPMQENIA